MLYIDRNTTGQISGTYQIDVARPAWRWTGQENSANGTGLGRACM
jgi:hypothetical protein